MTNRQPTKLLNSKSKLFDNHIENVCSKFRRNEADLLASLNVFQSFNHWQHENYYWKCNFPIQRLSRVYYFPIVVNLIAENRNETHLKVFRMWKHNETLRMQKSLLWCYYHRKSQQSFHSHLLTHISLPVWQKITKQFQDTLIASVIFSRHKEFAVFWELLETMIIFSI